MSGTEEALRQIFDRLGNIDAKLEAGGKRHEEFSHGLAEIDEKMGNFSVRLAKVEVRSARIPIIEKTLWNLEAGRLEASGAKKLIGGLLRLKNAIWLAICAVLAAFGIHLTGWPTK